MTLKIALVKWQENDGISFAIHEELVRSNYQVIDFFHNQIIPPGVDIVFTFAPYGRLYPILSQMAAHEAGKRPVTIFWHNQNQPNIRIPRTLMLAMAAMPGISVFVFAAWST